MLVPRAPLVPRGPRQIPFGFCKGRNESIDKQENTPCVNVNFENTSHRFQTSRRAEKLTGVLRMLLSTRHCGVSAFVFSALVSFWWIVFSFFWPFFLSQFFPFFSQFFCLFFCKNISSNFLKLFCPPDTVSDRKKLKTHRAPTRITGFSGKFRVRLFVFRIFFPSPRGNDGFLSGAIVKLFALEQSLPRGEGLLSTCKSAVPKNGTRNFPGTQFFALQPRAKTAFFTDIF
jgi:hypothetical protein